MINKAVCCSDNYYAVKACKSSVFSYAYSDRDEIYF